MSIADSRSNFGAPLSIYQAIVDHQRNAEWWAHRDELEWLRDWGQTFIKEFALLVKDGQFLPMPLVKIEPLNVSGGLSFLVAQGDIITPCTLE